MTLKVTTMDGSPASSRASSEPSIGAMILKFPEKTCKEKDSSLVKDAGQGINKVKSDCHRVEVSMLMRFP